jgi:dynein heavy chain
MPTKEEYGAQPPIELLRQIIDEKGFYRKNAHSDFNWYEFNNFAIIAAAAPTGGGR